MRVQILRLVPQKPMFKKAKIHVKIDPKSKTATEISTTEGMLILTSQPEIRFNESLEEFEVVLHVASDCFDFTQVDKR